MPPSETPGVVVKMRTTAPKKQKTEKDGSNLRPDGTPKPAGSSSSAVQCCTGTQRDGASPAGSEQSSKLASLHEERRRLKLEQELGRRTVY